MISVPIKTFIICVDKIKLIHLNTVTFILAVLISDLNCSSLNNKNNRRSAENSENEVQSNLSSISNSNQSVCGYITVKTSPKATKVDLIEGREIPPSLFTKIYESFNHTSSISLINDKCKIEICGYPGQGSTNQYHGQCEEHWESKKRLSVVPYGLKYTLSSISCGCEKNRPECPNQQNYCPNRNITENGICAILYQENNCNECIYNGIHLQDYGVFQTKNSAVIRSVVVRAGCNLVQTSYGYSAYDHEPSERYFKKSAQTMEPSFTKRGEEYKCQCLRMTSTTVASVASFEKESKRTLIASQPSKPEATLAPVLNNRDVATDENVPAAINVEKSELSPMMITVTGGLLGVLGIVLLVIGIIICIRQLKKPNSILTKMEIQQFEKGLDDKVEMIEMTNLSSGILKAYKLPYDNKFEISREHIKFNYLDPSARIGGGVFGIVYKGTLRTFDNNRFRDVAIKTIRPFSEAHFLKSLMNEIKLLAYIGYHENIVYFIGSCTVNLRRGEVFIIMELCSRGSLKDYLKSQKESLPVVRVEKNHKKINTGRSGISGYFNRDNTGDSDEDDLNHSQVAEISQSLFNNMVKWSKEIASGMEFLTEKNVLHFDLASRNILLSDDFTAKISDFGLSRKLYSKSDYEKQGNEPIPIAANALESLTENKYSVKSDVWAFGITLWEIFSLGEEPYEEMNYVQIIHFLNKGDRLKQPPYSTPPIYDKMLECWEKEPDERPTFLLLKVFFSRIQSNFEHEVIDN